MLVGHHVKHEILDDDAPLYPIEGQYTSAADKAHILGLPGIDRKDVLAERAANVARRQQDIELKRESTFTIHKNLVCATSKFLETTCSKPGAQARDKVVHLPDVEVGAFRAYIVWVCSGKVVVNKSTREDIKAAARDDLFGTVELYLLGVVLDDLLLRNAVMRILVTNSD